ncbi:glutathione transferase GTE1 [Cytidiella melzeri]|nr:glutathione transferase GTE1 [Cytidiella melzeri]
MPDVIILYDLDSTRPGRATSPMTWRARYALNYKGIPYKTEWLEYPDIEPLCRKIGAPPTGKKADGSGHYTVPMIYDPSTGKIISDSLAIAKYLDETYPSTPQLFQPGTGALQAACADVILPAVVLPTLFILLSRIADTLNPRSSAYFRATREEQFGKLEDMNTPKAWEDLEKGWGQVKSYLDVNGEGKNLSFLGESDKFTWCDIQLASTLIWTRTIAGKDSEDWKRIAGFYDSFGERLLAQFERYSVVDE